MKMPNTKYTGSFIKGGPGENQKIKKVMKGLQKASKTHAAQAKTLKGVLHGGSKKRNRKKA